MVQDNNTELQQICDILHHSGDRIILGMGSAKESNVASHWLSPYPKWFLVHKTQLDQKVRVVTRAPIPNKDDILPV